MIISDSKVLLQSSRDATQYHQKTESLTFWSRGRQPERLQNSSDNNSLNNSLKLQFDRQSIQLQSNRMLSSAIVSISDQARALEQSDEIEDEGILLTEESLSFNLSIVRMLVKEITGKELTIFNPKELEGKVDKIENRDHQNINQSNSNNDSNENSVGWGLRYSSEVTHYESEKVSFSATAKVKTADGKEIDIDLELNMSREFYSQEKITIVAGDALKDPLVINFSGTAAELTQTKYSFDIDHDGLEDQISFVKSGSGFLAHDVNQNGQVDNGSELFGALTGDGFAELAEYDEDNNGWIDESDSIYDKLQIWLKQPDGTDELIAIGEKNIGAIYLGSASTEFSVNGDNNQQLGQVRQTGIYLSEEGGVGTVQQLDLVV